MIPVEEHLARCLAGVGLLPPRDVPLLEARGRVLAEDVTSPVNLPPFANSAMDGYAVRLADLGPLGEAGAQGDHAGQGGEDGQGVVELPVAGDVPAGPSVPMALPAGAVVRVMTGAPVPSGTEAVVPVEWTDAGTERVRITQAPEPGQYLRRAGEDVDAGERVLRAGARLTPRRLAVAAAVGRSRVRVHPAPRIVVVSTGSELVPPGGQLGYGQIFDSNGYALVAAAAELGAAARYAGFVGDEEDAVRAALDAACADADLVITSGGVSAGAYDPVKAVLRDSGTMWFGAVAMQPGMPQGFGHYGGSAVLTLPGNPVSSMVSFEVFARPMLQAMLGRPDLRRPVVRAVAAVGWNSPARKRQFVRAVLGAAPGAPPGDAPGRPSGESLPTVRPVGAQGSHLVADLAEATCLAIVPEAVTWVEPGTELDCLVLDESAPGQVPA